MQLIPWQLLRRRRMISSSPIALLRITPPHRYRPWSVHCPPLRDPLTIRILSEPIITRRIHKSRFLCVFPAPPEEISKPS